MKSRLFKIIIILAAFSYSSAKSQVQQWANYSNGNNTRSIVIDNDIAWVGTDDGLAKFDGTTWTVYDESNSDIPSNYTEVLFIDDENIWVGTSENGLVKFDGSQWTIFNKANSRISDNNIESIIVDKNGTKWFGTLWKGVVFYNETGIATDIDIPFSDNKEETLYQNCPNPFSSETLITFKLHHKTKYT
jgi:ligand-binding sensor domain-containing protein